MSRKYTTPIEDAVQIDANRKEIVNAVIGNLEQSMTKTLAKRNVNILLLTQGESDKCIAELTGSSERSIWELRKALAKGEVESLFVAGGGSGNPGKIRGLEDAIVEEVETNNYHTYQQVADMVEEKHGIKMTSSGIGRMLKKKDIKPLKSGSLPAKGNPEKQNEFNEETLQPLIKRARKKEIQLFFLDGAHFVFGGNSRGKILGRHRKYVKTFPGRQRYNVLGALNFVSKKVTTVTNDTYITASTVCEMLYKLAEEYKGKQIHIVLDNARYQRCKVVMELAAEIFGITLHFLPTYSPNLNLIERLWKFVKKRLKLKGYENFSEYRGGIDSILNDTHKGSKKAINKLINKKVQIFDSLKQINKETFVVVKKKTKKKVVKRAA